jgi:hypothetical protein
MASQITLLPTPPTVADPTSFDARADAFLAALPPFATQTKTVAQEINQAALNVNGQYATITSSVAMVTTGNDFSSTLVEKNKLFIIGQAVIVYRVGLASTYYMFGNITGFNASSGAITVRVTSYTGTGTWNDYIVAASAPVLAPNYVGSTMYIYDTFGIL